MEKIGKGFIPMPYEIYKKMEEQVELAKKYYETLQEMRKEDDEWIANINKLEESGSALGLMDEEDNEHFKEFRQHYVTRLYMIQEAEKKANHILKTFDMYYTMH